MDRRSWPWKKKSSDRTTHVPPPQPVGEPPNDETLENQNNPKNNNNVVDYVQLPQERYMQLSEMEDQVKSLTEQLSTAQSELTTKDTLIKQHTKVAEEAVSGWEKAEAEAFTLKNHLESVTVLKLAAEDRAMHLDSALKDSLEEIRIVREESEHKLHDVVFANTKQWEKVNLELELKLNVFEEELLRANAENDALSRSLQERSSLLMELSEARAEADSEIELLKTNFQTCEKELNSIKYEFHIVSKELEIRSEEKNMSVRSAEVANKQHLEDVKKIAKIESECQRLRGLVRKKLPGPAALAQMKVDADYGETRLKRSPAKNSSSSPVPDSSLENIQQCQRENEFLTARMLATEEEMKMLKEALSNRNSELLESRNMYAKTASKLQNFEAISSHQRSPSKSNNESNTATSMSEEDGKSSNAGNSSRLELMDDFLEMEKLACLSTTAKNVSNTATSTTMEKLLKAISQIHDFVMLFLKSSDNGGDANRGIGQKVEELSSVTNRLVLSGEFCVDEFLVTLSNVLSEIDELGLGIFCNKDSDREVNSPDCIDKVTLLENKIVHHRLESGGKDRFPYSSDAEVLKERSGPDELETKGLEFEQLKLEKANLADDLAKCTEILEQTRSKLLDTEKHLEDLKSQFTACQKSNSLADTQLKCMVESYRSLENHSHELETEINLLQSKSEALDIELREERCAHREDLAKFKDLVRMCRKNGASLIYSDAATIDAGVVKTKQEMEIAAAAEKLAECQHTIFLLGKQFKSLNPSNNNLDFSDDVLSTSCSTPQSSSALRRTSGGSGESPYDTELVSPVLKPASFTPNFPKSSSRSSRSPSALSNSVEEKPGRSFGQLFSKGMK